MNVDRIFLDTNILVYAHDITAGSKHEKAKEIVLDLWGNRNGVISTQILQEFYVVVTRKLPEPLANWRAREIIENLLFWDVVVNDEKSILEAIDISERYKLSFWDALMVQSALKGDVKILFSEDLNSGQVIEGIKIENPFFS